MNYQYILYSIILASGMLTACSSEEPTIGGEDMNSARITAGINTSMSRAVGSQWEADDIGVTVIDAPNSDMEENYKNVRYKTDALGGSAVFAPEGNEGIFFQDASETVTFSAYGPYRDWIVAPDAEGFNTVDMADSQMGREAQKSIDFIHATGATASNASPTVTFTGSNAFRHVMSRLEIVVKISGSGDFSDNALSEGSYSLGGMKLQALFNPYTGEAKASDAQVVDDWYLNTLPSTTGNGGVSYSAILPPQTLDEALTFTARVDGQTYANSSLIKPALESGKSYRYTITVSKTGLTVSGCTITDWAVGGDLNGDATMPDSEPKGANIGDYYYSDGTYSSDYDANKNVIGIIFYVGHHPKDGSDYSDSGIGEKQCHGYVMALSYVYGFSNTSWLNKDTPVDIEGISCDTNDWNGYANQKAIERYANNNQAGIEFSDFQAAYRCSIYGTPESGDRSQFNAPEKSSGWFLPSAAQFVGFHTANCATGNLLNDKIDAVKSVSKCISNLSSVNSWSSTMETNSSSYKVLLPKADSGKASVYPIEISTSSFVRAILTF